MKQSVFYIIMSAAAFCGVAFFFLLRQPQKIVNISYKQMEENSEDMDAKDSNMLIKKEASLEKVNFIEDIKDTWNMLKSRRMMQVVPSIIWSAWS